MDKNRLVGLQRVLAECALDNRLLILDMMGDSPMTVRQVEQGLENSEIEKSYAVVKRYLKSLEKVGLVQEGARGFTLTNLGTYMIRCTHCMLQNKKALDTHREFLEKFTVSPLPTRFMHRLSVLNHAERVTDSFSFVSTFMEAIGNSKKSINLIANKVSIQFFEHITARAVNGVVYRGINERENTHIRLKYIGEMISKFEIKGRALRDFRDVFKMKEHGGVPIHAIVVDDEIAGINFPYRDGRSHLESAFISENRDFVDWVNEIFEHFWTRGEMIKY